MQRLVPGLIVVVLGLLGVAMLQMWSSAQQPQPKAKPASDANRLEFEVVQSFDAKYEGDTPGHMGRAGGLQNRRPRVALGDPIYRGDERVGSVTGLTWNRANGSLDIEFDPAMGQRICVGDGVWIALDAARTAGGTH